MTSDANLLLQERVAGLSAWIDATPGICNGGRSLCCDDLEALGWRQVEAILERDGLLTFRFLQAEMVSRLARWAESRGYRLDIWDTFLGTRRDVIAAAATVLATPPAGLEAEAVNGATDAGTVEEIGAVMAASGVTPFVTEFIVGCREPVRTLILRDGAGRVVATALGHRAHRPGSRFRDYLFGGAVAVAPTHRGRGLGRYVNALMATRVLREFDASHLYELVSADNVASRRMVEASGLRRDPDVLAAAVSAGKAKFTR